MERKLKHFPCLALIWALGLFIFGSSAGQTLTVDVNASMSSADIAAVIRNAPASSELIVRVGSGVYELLQSEALLTTRVTSVRIQAFGGNTDLECTSTSSQQHAAVTSLPIIVRAASGYALEGAAAHALSLVGCPVVFADAEGAVTISGVRVADNKVLPGGAGGNVSESLAAVAVVRNQTSSATSLTTVLIAECEFVNNAITPLLLSAPGSCISVQGTRFLSNRVHVDETYSRLLNVTNTSLVSGGLAVRASPPGAACDNKGHDVVVDSCRFLANRLTIGSLRGLAASQLNPEENKQPVDVLNGELGACGGGLYVQLPAHLPRQANILGSNLTFSLNIAEDESHRNGARQDSHAGAACVQFLAAADSHEVLLSGAEFSGSRAYRAGALLVSFEDGCKNSKFTLTGESLFDTNTAQQSSDAVLDTEARGGAISVHFSSTAANNYVSIQKTTFTGNSATEGGAVFVTYYPGEKKNHAHIKDCTFMENKAVTGAGVYIWSGHSVGTTIQPLNDSRKAMIVPFHNATVLENVTFVNNTAYMSGSVYGAYTHISFQGTVLFANNTNTALSLVNSFAYISDGCQMTFYGNVGGVGGAVYTSNGQIILYSNVTVNMVSNIAQATGGAIHADMHTRSLMVGTEELTPHCFLTYYLLGTELQHWEVSVVFKDNKAGQAGAGIYAPDFTACLFLANYNEHTSNSLAYFKGVWDRLFFSEGGNVVNSVLTTGSPYHTLLGASNDAIPVWNKLWEQRLLPAVDLSMTMQPEFSRTSVNDTLTSDMVSLTWIASEECPDVWYDDSNMTHHLQCKVSSGQVFHISAVAVDQFGSKRDGLLFIAFSGKQSNAKDRVGMANTFVVLNKTTSLTQAFHMYGSPGNNVTFIVSAVGTARIVTQVLHIYFEPCHHGFEGRGPEGPDDYYKCVCNTKKVLLCEDGYKIYFREGQWAGDHRPVDVNCKNITTPEERETCLSYIYSEKFEVAVCPVGYCTSVEGGCSTSSEGGGCLYNNLNQDAICANNRTGMLCGSCMDGLTPSLTIESGSCNVCSRMSTSAIVSVVMFIVGVVFAVLLVLYLNVPLSNDMRGFFFFACTVRTIICPQDLLMLEKSYEWLLYMLLAGEMSWVSHECFVPGLTATWAIGLGYPVPIGAAILTGLIHYLTRKNKRLATYTSSPYNNIWQGTWLIIFFCFQRVWQISIKYMQCMKLFGDYRFYYNANFICFTQLPHAPWFFFALVLMAILIGVMYAAWRLAAGKSVKFLKDSGIFIGSVLRRGLHKNVYWWAVWDLARRVLVLFMSLFVLEGCVPRQMAMMSALLIVLAVHLWYKPYETPTSDGTDIGERKLRFATPPFLRSGTACNKMETILLLDLCILTAFSYDTRHEYIPLPVAAILITVPLCSFGLLLLYKLVTLLIFKLNKTQHCSCLETQPNITGLLPLDELSRSDEEDQPLLQDYQRLRPGLLFPQEKINRSEQHSV